MDNRKKIFAGEKLEHTGDLTIDSIEGNAELKLTDGLLIVKGNIEPGAKITLKVTKEAKQSFSAKSVTIGGFGHIRSSVISGISGYSDMNENSLSISAEMALGDDVYIGNVNINNRILTNHKIQILSPGNYRITPFATKTATAIIDNIHYTGCEISVTGNDVYVDKVKKTNSDKLDSKLAVSQSTPKLVVQGSILGGVIINSDAPMEVKNDIGRGCQIYSTKNGLTARNLAEDVVVNVRDKINVRDIGDRSQLTSNNDGIDAANIGQNVAIKTRDTITVRNIGDNSTLTSSNYGMDAEHVGNSVTISTRDAIAVKSIGNSTRLTSSNYGITVNAFIGHRVSLTARDAININTAGDHCNLTSSNDGVTIHGKAGNHLTITARDAVIVSDVGDHPTIKSSVYGVTARNVGAFGSIEARDDITINGSWFNSTKMRSSTGRVIKNGPELKPADVKEIESKLSTMNIHQSLAAIAVARAEVKAVRPSAPIAHAISDAKKSPESDKSEIDLSLYSKHTQNYLLTFKDKDKIPLSKRIEEVIQLVPEAEERFAEFIDHITENYMDIPVTLNEINYNLDTLRTWHAQGKGDPLTREAFNLSDIQSARLLYNKAEELIKQVMNEKQQSEKNSAGVLDEVPIAPGGPGFHRAVG